MMSLEKVVEMVEALGRDAYYDVYEDEDGVEVSVGIRDFDGFDEDWDEVIRELDDEEAVDRFEKMLEQECVSHEGDEYVIYYHFEGFDVSVRYDSSDI
jgi:hypothetical protein